MIEHKKKRSIACKYQIQKTPPYTLKIQFSKENKQYFRFVVKLLLNSQTTKIRGLTKPSTGPCLSLKWQSIIIDHPFTSNILITSFIPPYSSLHNNQWLYQLCNAPISQTIQIERSFTQILIFRNQGAGAGTGTVSPNQKSLLLAKLTLVKKNFLLLLLLGAVHILRNTIWGSPKTPPPHVFTKVYIIRDKMRNYSKTCKITIHVIGL